MKNKFHQEYLVLILGAITLLLFSTKPYILDLIEPAKSLGQVIGENAKDLLESLNGETEKSNSPRTKRALWANILTILAFVFFAASILMSIYSVSNHSKKWYGIAGGTLSIFGVAIYITQLAISLIGFMVIAVLIVGLVITEGL